jgi:hypothetical protein
MGILRTSIPCRVFPAENDKCFVTNASTVGTFPWPSSNAATPAMRCERSWKMLRQRIPSQYWLRHWLFIRRRSSIYLNFGAGIKILVTSATRKRLLSRLGCRMLVGVGIGDGWGQWESSSRTVWRRRVVRPYQKPTFKHGYFVPVAERDRIEELADGSLRVRLKSGGFVTVPANEWKADERGWSFLYSFIDPKPADEQ